MSIEIFKKILNLEFTERIGRTEYCDHALLIKHITGLDPLSENPDEAIQATRRFFEWVPYDFLWATNDGPYAWKDIGRATDMGHAVYVEGGIDYREPAPCPFKSVDKVLNFDAAEEYGIPDIEKRSLFFKKSLHYCPIKVF